MRRPANRTYDWYEKLKKPRWAPPNSLFGKVWTILYIVIGATFGYVFWRTYQNYFPLEVALPFMLNLVANALFTPLQFGLKSNKAALIDILITDATLIWAMVAIWPYSHLITYLQIPYLCWALFATALQISITILNSDNKSTHRR
jgi:translocator protein